MQEMSSRLSSLQQECREMRRLLTIATGLSIACLFICFAIAFDAIRGRVGGALRVATLEAEYLTIRSASGGPALNFGKNVAGQQSISFHDSNGACRIRIGLGGDGSPSLSLFDKADVPRVGLGLRSLNGGVASILDFRNETNEQRLALGLSDGGLPRATWRDRAGTIRVGIELAADDLATLQLSSPHAGGNRAIRLRTATDAEPAIDVFKGGAHAYRLPIR
jgi:hypothetical protein